MTTMNAYAQALIPATLDGRTVLDVGGYDGQYARLCVERGAASVTVIDTEQWRGYGWPEPHPWPDSITYHKTAVLDYWAPADVVLCFNMLYHVKDVWGTLEHLRKLTRERLLLYTQILPDVDEPVWRNWQKQDANYQDQCYWKPSEAGLRSLLEEVGFASTVRAYGDNERIALECLPR